MSKKPLNELTNEALTLKAKSMKSGRTFDAVVVGLLIGIALYSTFNNGYGLLTFLPLIYVPVAGKNQVKYKAVQDLMKERNLS